MDTPLAHAGDTSLEHLAESIRRHGWRTPALLLLSTTSPIGFVGRQLLLLTQPLYGVGPLARYATIMQQPAAWDDLAALLAEETGS